MAYLNLELGYFDHPQTKRLVSLLGRGSEVLPIRLWDYCGRFHAESGRLTDLSAPQVEELLAWWGSKGRALEAMMSRGVDYLGLDGGTYYAQHWERHQGHIWALKVRARENANKKWAAYRQTHASSIASSSASSIASSNAHSVPALPAFFFSLDEIKKYAKEKKIKTDVEAFVRYNQARAWKGVADWRPLLELWAQRNPLPAEESLPSGCGCGRPATVTTYDHRRLCSACAMAEDEARAG